MPSTQWRAGETITGEGRLELLERDSVKVAGSSSPGVLTFEFAEVDGRRMVKPVWTSDCGAHHTLGVANPIVLPLEPTGGAFPPRDDPDWDWYGEFTNRRDVQLPAGQWDITAVASFSETWDCPPPRAGIGLTATIRVTVVP